MIYSKDKGFNKRFSIYFALSFAISSFILLIYDYSTFIYSYFLTYHFYLLISTSSLFLLLLLKTLNSRWQILYEDSLLSFSYLLRFSIPVYMMIFWDNIIIKSIVYPSSTNGLLNVYSDSLFLSIRHIIVLIILLIISLKNKKAQDSKLKNSGYMLLLTSLSIIILGIDFSLSFSTKWFNSVWCIYYLSIGLQLSVALWILFLQLKFKDRTNDLDNNTLSNLGKLLFTFTFLFGYFFFTQFLIVSYSNIPEEMHFYVQRMQGYNQITFYIFISLSFLFPFVALLFKKVKTNLSHLKIISLITLIGQISQFYWILFPQINTLTVNSTILSLIVLIFFSSLFFIGTRNFKRKFSYSA